MTTISDLLGRREPELLNRHLNISAKEARNNFSEIMQFTDFKEQRVIITHRGKPKMALVPIRDLERLEELDAIAAAKPEGAGVLDDMDAATDRDGEEEYVGTHDRRVQGS